jgi:hypothetical protein
MLKRLTSGGSGLKADISGAALKAMVGKIWQDLRDKKLWPVALVLLLALVAVPVLLSKSSNGPSGPPAAAPQAPIAGLPAVSEHTVTSSRLHKSNRDPFTPQGGGPSTSTGAAQTSGSSGSVVSSTGSAVTTSGTGASTSTGTGTSPSSASGSSSPGAPTGGSSPTSPPAGGNGSGGHGSGGHNQPASPLTPRESFGVRLAMTTPRGGVRTINPLERLTPLPAVAQPLMVELGVLTGGNRVVFALSPRTVVSGPGRCIPGPLDCEILSMARGQRERLGFRNSHRATEVAVFAVAAITIEHHASQRAAMRVRNQASGAGRRVLNSFFLPALSLFRYSLSVGAVIDQRNLTVTRS